MGLYEQFRRKYLAGNNADGNESGNITANSNDESVQSSAQPQPQPQQEPQQPSDVDALTRQANDAYARADALEQGKDQTIAGLINSRRKSIADLSAEQAADDKRARANRVIGGLASSISAISNLITTAHGAKNIKVPSYGAIWQRQADAVKAARGKQITGLSNDVDAFQLNLATAQAAREVAKAQRALAGAKTAAEREQKQKEYDLKVQELKLKKKKIDDDNNYRDKQFAQKNQHGVGVHRSGGSSGSGNGNGNGGGSKNVKVLLHDGKVAYGTTAQLSSAINSVAPIIESDIYRHLATQCGYKGDINAFLKMPAEKQNKINPRLCEKVAEFRLRFEKMTMGEYIGLLQSAPTASAQISNLLGVNNGKLPEFTLDDTTSDSNSNSNEDYFIK